MSPTTSPTISPIPSRRASLRRGSISASDPYGKHLDINANPARTISSKLTIVRVEPQQPEQEPPRSSSPQHFRDRRQHKRHGSNSSVGSNQGESGRLSFAFTTFGPNNGSNGGRSSPTSGRSTPGSPGGHPPQQRKIPSTKPRLAPEQVIELARSSTNPKSTPNVNSSSIPASASAPNFTPLPDDVYLPFIDRAAEVSALISTPPTAKLFTLLTQAFPLGARQPDDKVKLADFAEKDPKLWTRAQLEYWFRHVDRDAASDEEWAVKARACVHSHSELLWERIKGALGIPPELDVSEEEVVEEGDANGSDPGLVMSPVDVEHRADFGLGDHNPGNYPDVFDDDYDAPPLSIEPVFASDPNSSQPGDPQVGLGDISEAAEEEAENADEEQDASSPQKQEEIIQGLRISASFSSPASHLHGNMAPTFASPIATGGGDGGGTNPSSNVEGGHRLRRSNSSSSSIHLDGRLSPYFAYRGARDDDYTSGIERGPGNPLFPSTFANLAASPTLRTNLQRRSSLPHQPWTSIRAVLAKRRGSNFAMSDYAMTTASEGSVAGEA